MFKTVDGELKVFNKTILSTQNNLKNLQTQTANLSYYTSGGNHVNLQNVPIAQPQPVSNFAKLNNAFNVYNSNLTKSTGLQNAYIKSVGTQNQALGNYLAGLNGTKASMGGYIASLIGAKAATIGLQVASMALNMALSMGVAFAIQGIITLFDKLITTSKEQAEKLQNVKQEYENVKSELQSLNDELKTTEERMTELENKNTLTFTEKEEYDNLVKTNNELQRKINLLELEEKIKNKEKNKTFVDTMNKSGNAAVTMMGNTTSLKTKDFAMAEINRYESLVADGITEDEEKQVEYLEGYLQDLSDEWGDYAKDISYISNPTNKDEEKVNEWLDFVNDFQDRMAIAMGGDNAKENAFNRIVDNWQFDDTVQGLQDLGKEGKVTAEMLNDPKYDAFIQKLYELGIIDSVDNLDAIALAFNNIGTEAENADEKTNKMTVSLSNLKTASESISSLASAFKELDEDGYITTETIFKIQEAVGESIYNWEEYENILLTAKKGTDEFNQALSELTYAILENEFAEVGLENATEEQIAAVLRENGVVNAGAIAHYASTKAKAEVKAANFELSKSIDENSKKLIEEAESCGISTVAYAQLVAQEIIFNSNTFDISDKISKLETLQQALGQTTSAAITLNSVLAGQSIDGRLEMAMAIQQYGIKRTGDGFKYNGVTYKSGRDAVNAAMMSDFSKNLKIDIPKVDYSGAAGGGGGGGGGSKDEPKQHDVTEAIIDRINLAHTQRKNVIETLKDNADLAESEKKYAEALQITNQLVSEKKTRITELETANSSLSKEAQKIRDANPWNEDEWFDSEGNATEAYYALLNQQTTGSAQDEIQKVFDTLSKFKEAYKNNAEEIRQINSDIIQDGETIQDIYQNMYDDYIRDVEHSRDLALESNPYEDVRPYYDKLQEAYHKEAERLRAIDPVRYADEIQELQRLWHDAQNAKLNWRWENSQNWIDQRNAFGDWDVFNDSEVKAWERIVKWVREEYPNDLDKIKEAERSLFEARKKEINEELDLQISKLASLKTLLQSHYDVTNSIAEAQHEIDKELEASKTMYEYLDESTRKLLFNQEDYNELTAELAILQTEANNLQARYNRDILSATAENLDEITSQYQVQYETMMKQYEIAKAELDITKKRQQLNNVLNEKNVRMLVNGRWTWVANADDVIKAQSELADAEYAKQTSENTLKQAQAINEITTTEKVLNTTLNNIDKGFIGLESSVSDLTDAFDDINTDGILSLKSIIGNIESAGAAYINAINSDDYSGEYKKTSKTSNVDSLAVVYASQDYSQGIYNDLAKGDIASAKKKNELRNQKIDYLGLKVDKWDDEYIDKLANGGHANGTRYSPGGWKKLGEDGSEFLITPGGQLIPINQPMIGNLDSGSIVFNQSQLKNLRSLWDLSNLNMVSHSNLISKSQPISGDTNCNNIVINGMVIEEKGNEDWISGFKRYVATHKH